MLIVPIENRPDWNKPPLITLALVLINLAVFLSYQGQDSERAFQAESFYREQKLLEHEREPYFDYLQTDAAASGEQTLNELEEIEDEALLEEVLIWSILSDREFDRYLEQLWESDALADTMANRAWRSDRARFEQLRNRLSSYQGGLTPAEPSALTFVTSQFLHGGWAHLIGNMVFLFLFGFALEAVLRPYLYLAMYLACGVAANGLHLWFNLDSMVPVVGASGAISGLMGMYLALYRLRKIRFFYNFLFYFGELRAPALLILPLWLAKELYGYFFIDSSTAYWAHIGGLVAGAGLMFAVPRQHQTFEQKLQVEEKYDALERGLDQVQLAMTELDFVRAKIRCRQLCLNHPNDPRPWQQLFDLHKGQPQKKTFHQVTFDLLKQFVLSHEKFPQWHSCVEDILHEYKILSPKMPALNSSMSLALAKHYWVHRHARISEEYLRRAVRIGASPGALTRLLQTMIAHYEKRHQRGKASQLVALLKKLPVSEKAGG